MILVYIQREREKERKFGKEREKEWEFQNVQSLLLSPFICLETIFCGRCYQFFKRKKKLIHKMPSAIQQNSIISGFWKIQTESILLQLTEKGRRIPLAFLISEISTPTWNFLSLTGDVVVGNTSFKKNVKLMSLMNQRFVPVFCYILMSFYIWSTVLRICWLYPQ